MEVLFYFVLFTLMLGLVKGYTFEVFKYYSMTYNEAKSHCESDGQDLAFIKTSDDLSQAIQYLTATGGLVDDVYIGMNWHYAEYKFKWLDGDTVTFADWSSNGRPAEPNCMSGYQSCWPKQNCVRLSTTYKLLTTTCSYEYDVLCGKVSKPAIEQKLLKSDIQATSATSNEVETTKDRNFEFTTTQSLPNSDVQTTPATNNGNENITDRKLQYTTIKITTTPTSIVNNTSEIIETTLTSTESSQTSINYILPETTCDSYINNSLSCVCTVTYVNSKWNAINQRNLTDDELRKIVNSDFEQNIKPYISVNTEQLSSVKRSKSSAPDDRSSSASIGWVAIFFLLLPVVLALTIDFISFLQNI